MADENLSLPTRTQILEEFAAAFRAMREVRKLTLDEIASRSGIKISKLERLELGKYDPLLDDLLKLAKGFEMDAGEFVRLALASATRPAGGDE